jgi:hypothetical protein
MLRRWLLVKRNRKQLLALILGVVLLTVLHGLPADEFECPLGKPFSANLGDGVTLQSCNWEKTPGNYVRTGPLEMVKDGILILQLQTDLEGRLHGDYTVWDDQGVVTTRGQYRAGLKEGEWRITDKQGNTSVIVYSAGTAATH